MRRRDRAPESRIGVKEDLLDRMPLRGEIAARALVGVAWALALGQVLTIQPVPPAAFPEPLSWEHWGLVMAFLATSPGPLHWTRRRFVSLLHATVVAGLVALHPLTAFGRDGSVVVLILWLGVVLARMGVRREWLVVYASGAIGLLAGEALLSNLGRDAPPANLPDYDAVIGSYGDCGFLPPNLNLQIVGEDHPARFVTNNLGLRYDGTAGPPKGRRILLLGDSFVAGYRTDQQDTIGSRLQAILREKGSSNAEVMSGGVGYPGAGVAVVSSCVPRVMPDMVVIGVTLGNDLSQSWLESRGLAAGVLDALLLPSEASKTPMGLLPIRVLRSGRAWRFVRLIEAVAGTDVIASWYRDTPTSVHVFDALHGLGLFYVRQDLEVVRESYKAAIGNMAAVAAAGGRLGVPVTFAFFPQRFQLSDKEWKSTLFEYGLDPSAFDWTAPNKRLTVACRAAGLTCVDLLPAFRKASAMGPLHLGRGDMHWNRRGHAVAAAALAAALQP